MLRFEAQLALTCAAGAPFVLLGHSGAAGSRTRWRPTWRSRARPRRRWCWSTSICTGTRRSCRWSVR
ncbi:hypothetical protein NKH77_48625 [Streptomyces sp. M19]